MSSGAQAYIAIVTADPLDPTTIPTGPAERVNFTDEDIGAGVSSNESNHVRPDRMTQDVTVVGVDVAGGFNSECHFAAMADDILIAAALWSDWEGLMQTGETSIDLTGAIITATGGILNLAALTTIPDNINKQGVFRVKIEGTATSDGLYTLAPSGTANEYTMIPEPPADEDVAAGDIIGEVIRNKSVYKPFFIEKGLIDVSEYFQFMGMAVNTWALSIPDQDFITSNYTFIGLTTEVVQTPTFDDQYTGPTANPSMSSVANVPEIQINNVPLSDCLVQSLTMEVNNNVAGKTGVGVFGYCATTPHKFQLTGKLSMYFNDSSKYQWLLAGQEFALGWTLRDNLGNEYVYDLPRCKITEDPINVTGADDDVMDDAGYMALADNDTAAQIIVHRFPVTTTP